MNVRNKEKLGLILNLKKNGYFVKNKIGKLQKKKKTHT